MAALWCRLVNRSTQRAWRAPLLVIPSPWTARRPHATGRRTGLGQHPGDRRARVRAQSKAHTCPALLPDTASHHDPQPVPAPRPRPLPAARPRPV